MERVKMELSSDLNEWTRVKRAIIQFCEHHEIATEVSLTLQLVGEEWFINIIDHGFNNERVLVDHPYIQFDIWLSSPDEITIQFTDNAIPFNPLTREDPDVSLSAEERSIGGLGIYLIKSKMDDYVYCRANDCNRFTMIKKING